MGWTCDSCSDGRLGGMTFSVSELREKISGGVLVPGDEGYEASLHRWAANAERKAGVVVLVENTSDVAAAVPPPVEETDGSLISGGSRGWRLRLRGGSILLRGLPPRRVGWSLI
jgi:hypothetical protein